MLKLSVREKKILDALLLHKPWKVAELYDVKIQTVYNVKNYYRRKVQNAREFLAVAKSKYKPILTKKLSTPRVVPIIDERELWSSDDERWLRDQMGTD